jgi:hypothetical protein
MLSDNGCKKEVIIQSNLTSGPASVRDSISTSCAVVFTYICGPASVVSPECISIWVTKLYSCDQSACLAYSDTCVLKAWLEKATSQSLNYAASSHFHYFVVSIRRFVVVPRFAWALCLISPRSITVKEINQTALPICSGGTLRMKHIECSTKS